MALLILCSICGQQHLQGMSCNPFDVEWKKEMEHRNEISELKSMIRDLQERVKKLEVKEV